MLARLHPVQRDPIYPERSRRGSLVPCCQHDRVGHDHRLEQGSRLLEVQPPVRTSGAEQGGGMLWQGRRLHLSSFLRPRRDV
jgi:hypothetical protein